MDGSSFDALTCTLTAAGSRRRALTGLVSSTLGLALGASSIAEVVAKKKKPCPPCKKRKQGKCKKAPDGTACSGGTCQNGQCRCTPTCDRKICGSDGCGGSCGTCVAPETCQNGECRCTRSCAPTDACGPDGCGSFCGTCPTNSSCSATGVCVCDDSSGEEMCKGTCVDKCTDPETTRDPNECRCCVLNGESGFLSETSCVAGCCSEKCDPDPSRAGQWKCVGQPGGQSCTFHAQCASHICQFSGGNGFCFGFG